MKTKKYNTIMVIEWTDSYGALAGWINIDTMEKPVELICISCGIVVYENKKVVALAPNFAQATTYTPKQGNGIMVIPKSCIKKVSTFSYQDAGLTLKPQHS